MALKILLMVPLKRFLVERLIDHLQQKGRKTRWMGMENEKLTCGAQNGVSGVPWLGEFSSLSDRDFLEAKNTSLNVGISCSFDEFQRFDSFFSKFMTVAREIFLPPERLKFGLVPERSLLSSLVDVSGSRLSFLDVGDSDSWLMILYFAGCPTCSKVLREGDDLKSALHMQNSLFIELGGDKHDPEPVLPANKPSILLFIDRSSDSLEIRRKSKEAIDAFRNLAWNYQTPCGIGKQKNLKTDKSLFDTYQASKSKPGHQMFKSSPTSQNLALDKMSIMIINEEKHVTLDQIASGLQGNSLHEILAYVLQHKKEEKLSSLAKKVGFQLLSEDFDIKTEEALPTQKKVPQSDKVLLNTMKGHPQSSVGLHRGQIPGVVSTSAAEQYKPANAGEPSQYTEEKRTLDRSRQSSGGRDHFHGNEVLGSAEDENEEQRTFPKIAKLGEEKLHRKCFMGSFFYSDGGYQLLKTLTAFSKIPSVVIVDPIKQKHYVLPDETVFSHSSLLDFVVGFLNGSLLPYQRSESSVSSPREAASPPFVNLDFHEVDSIPRVTTTTFSELVIGFNEFDISNANNARKKDVLVLFSNRWCGFCQRMELVVREVFRAFKHSATMLKNGPRNEKSVLSDDLGDIALRVPLIYFMDCTLNECSLILRSAGQGELYPSLLLFPAERKNAVSYEGDVAVSDITKFIFDHGNNAPNLFKENGILQTKLEEESRKQNLYEDASQIATHKAALSYKNKHHEVLLKYRAQEKVVRYNQIRPSKSNGLQGAAAQVIVGSLLIATEKLLKVHPFDKSTILIVKSDQGSGFQGLIMNKHISWDSLHELEERREPLREARLSFGGPVLKHGMPLVALTRRTFKEQYPEIVPNVYFLDQLATIYEMDKLKLHNNSVADYWFFLGYSSWGWDQLFDEIAQGTWNISSDYIKQLDWPWR
ncbi:uncharacterized protein LOC130769028 isoform X3 [Actinidia eriantha]|uniref:uncharacterized protein LOC130769028 isoform X3 n=2 Tax=Actinidia eriantha TaxID=165200 RepID=UPI002582EC58|nr:uncharacterized protein LOC130769028 isoform X3 [Actinidia eriantha]